MKGWGGVEVEAVVLLAGGGGGGGCGVSFGLIVSAILEDWAIHTVFGVRCSLFTVDAS